MLPVEKFSKKKNYLIVSCKFRRIFFSKLKIMVLIFERIGAPTFEFSPFVSTSSRTLTIEVKSGKRANTGAVGTNGLSHNL